MTDDRSATISEIVNANVSAKGVRPFARELGVAPGLVYYAIHHEPKRSSKIAKVLREQGYIRTVRCRLSADVSREQREMLKSIAAEHKLSWTDLCREIADSEFFIVKN